MARNLGHPAGNWYRDALQAQVPVWPRLEELREVDVCVVGAGFTGLGAALALARQGVSVCVLEAAQVGSGGSGRNGGQIHPGQRRDQPWLEQHLGPEAARGLWDLAERARASLFGLIQANGIDCDLRPGLIHAQHRPGRQAEDAAHVEHLHKVYGYDQCQLLSPQELSDRVGSPVYHGGLIDHGGGHLHPLKLALSMASLASAGGADIYEHSRVLSWTRRSQGFEIRTARGQVHAARLILTGDGYVDGLAGQIEARVMPINNFIAVTEPLDDPTILPGNEAVADSRFVINYFRKTADNRLLFGGGESYTPWFPADIAAFVRPHLQRVFPQLKGVTIRHAWGGTLGVTLHRLPYVREIEAGTYTAAGYSGQGVMLGPYVGGVLARACLGDTAELDLMAALPVPAFPGGRLLRWPALVAGMSWYALRDRWG